MAATSGAAGRPAADTGTSPSPELRWRQVYHGDDSQISELRRWLTGLLPGCEARDDVVAVAVELATNAVQHTASGQGGWFALEVTWYRYAVRVAVADGGAEAGPRLVDDPMSECGRGLQVVHALSARTGVAGDKRGRLVWAEIPWTPGDTGAMDGSVAGAYTATPLDGYEAAVREGEEILARRHAGIPTWFGRATMQWWALVGGPGEARLVAASTPQELSDLLGSLREEQGPGARRPGKRRLERQPSGGRGQVAGTYPAPGLRTSSGRRGLPPGRRNLPSGVAALPPGVTALPQVRPLPSAAAARADEGLQAS